MGRAARTYFAEAVPCTLRTRSRTVRSNSCQWRWTSGRSGNRSHSNYQVSLNVVPWLTSKQLYHRFESRDAVCSKMSKRKRCAIAFLARDDELHSHLSNKRDLARGHLKSLDSAALVVAELLDEKWHRIGTHSRERNDCGGVAANVAGRRRAEVVEPRADSAALIDGLAEALKNWQAERCRNGDHGPKE
jgi:hypothetical protein